MLLLDPDLQAGSCRGLQSNLSRLRVRRKPALVSLAPAMCAVHLPQREVCWSACAGNANAQAMRTRRRGDAARRRAAVMCLAQQGSPILLGACQPGATCSYACAGGAYAERGASEPGAGLLPYPRLTKEAINALRYRGEDVARSLTKTVIKEVSSCFLLARPCARQLPLQFCKSLSLGRPDCHHRGELEPDLRCQQEGEGSVRRSPQHVGEQLCQGCSCQGCTARIHSRQSAHVLPLL